MLEQDNGNLDAAYKNYRSCYELNDKFYPAFLNLRMAQVAEKLDFLDQALDYLLVCEQLMKHDRHAINILKGKIYDKKHHFVWAVEEYETAILLVQQLNRFPAANLADLRMRLGWSRIRSRRNIDKGVVEMKTALEMVPNNTEFAIKLASSVYSYLPQSPDNDKLIMDLTDKVCKLAPADCCDALILQGKVLFRQEKYDQSIIVFQTAQKQTHNDIYFITQCYFYLACN
jgi:tetratricopeptide (TPR) repeat protein